MQQINAQSTVMPPSLKFSSEIYFNVHSKQLAKEKCLLKI